MNGKYMADGELKLVALNHAVTLATHAQAYLTPAEIVDAARLFYRFLTQE